MSEITQDWQKDLQLRVYLVVFKSENLAKLHEDFLDLAEDDWKNARSTVDNVNRVLSSREVADFYHLPTINDYNKAILTLLQECAPECLNSLLSYVMLSQGRYWAY